MVEILKTSSEQLKDIFQLESISFKNSYKMSELYDLFKNPSYEIIAIFNKKLLGYIIILDSIDLYDIIKIAISPDSRGEGYGKQLLNYTFQHYHKNFILEVRESNKNAINLYENLGFKNITIRKKYYNDPEDDALIYLYENSINK